MVLNHSRRMSRTSSFAGAIPLLQLVAWSVISGQGKPTSQTAARSNYVLVYRNDTTSTESVEREGNNVRGEVQLFSSHPVTYKYKLQFTPDALVSRFELDAFEPKVVRPQVSIAIAFRGDSLIAESRMGDSSRAERIGGFTATLPYVGPSIAIFEQLGRRARALGDAEADIRVLHISHGVTTAHVTQLGRDSIVVTLEDRETRLAIDKDGNILGGIVPGRQTRILLVK